MSSQEEPKKNSYLVPLNPMGMPIIPQKWENDFMIENAKVAALTSGAMESEMKLLDEKSRFSVNLQKIEMGRELGLPWMAALRVIKLTYGQLELKTEAKWGILINYIPKKEPEAKIEVVHRTNDRAELKCLRPKSIFGNNWMTFFWTKEMARTAGLDKNGKGDKNPWVYDTVMMLWWRAVGDMIRTMWPDLFEGFSYSQEEVADFSEDDVPIKSSKNQNAMNVSFEEQQPKTINDIKTDDAPPEFDEPSPKVQEATKVDPIKTEIKTEPKTITPPLNDDIPDFDPISVKSTASIETGPTIQYDDIAPDFDFTSETSKEEPKDEPKKTKKTTKKSKESEPVIDNIWCSGIDSTGDTPSRIFRALLGLHKLDYVKIIMPKHQLKMSQTPQKPHITILFEILEETISKDQVNEIFQEFNIQMSEVDHFLINLIKEPLADQEARTLLTKNNWSADEIGWAIRYLQSKKLIL